MSLKNQAQRLMAAILLVGCLAAPHSAQSQTAPPEKPERGVAPSHNLLQGFEAATVQLQEHLKTWESRLAAATDRLAQTQPELDSLQVAVASLKAAMALQKLPLLRVQEHQAVFAGREKELKGKLKELDQEIDALQKDRQAQIESQNTLRVQFNIIRAKAPEAAPLESQSLFLRYLSLAGRRDALAGRVLEQLEQRRRLLQQEQELLAGLLPQLQQLEDVWKAELLKRPAEAVPFWEQVLRVWRSLASIPQRGWGWLQDLVHSGRLGAFIWGHLAPIIGLLGFMLLLGWGARRLNDLMVRRFQDWKERHEESDLLPLYILGKTLIDNLIGLRLIFWVGLFGWTFNLLGSDPAQLILAALAILWILRLGLQLVQRFFADQAAGGLLALTPDVSRFYRRSLKLFLMYFFLGLFGLKGAGLLDFPESSRLFLEHFFLMGVLVGIWWLLRRPYLSRLLPELSEPTWLHRPWVSLFLRGLVLSLLVIIILADLLGFVLLSIYLAKAAAWTLLAALVIWLLWLIGERLIHHLLHPEAGRATSRFPERVELIQRVYVLSRWALSISLGAAVVLWSLNSWGITPTTAVWAFNWITWGPNLGPVKLSTLNIVGVILTLYLGFFLSRLVRSFTMVRIFPRTALDRGVQYTISTTVHYVILVLAGLLALNILGFPLTNLLLLFGALGVGIGFGLQNIVNNFLSGLILLFERPIKVGDMLVIDGQWGLVKEIRVRSTVFETFDRYVMIIPNSELVSGKVINWTHYGPGVNRLTLKVGVSYGSDVQQVTQLVTDICRANYRVVPEPPPQVYFSAYGDSSLDFTIWVHLRTPGDRQPATHELNLAIFEAFNRHGVEIPFPQRDLHIKEWPQPWEKKGEG